jgi:large repetitive protein
MIGRICRDPITEKTDQDYWQAPTQSGTITLTAASGCAGIDVCKNDAASIFSVDPDPEITSYAWTIRSLPLPGTSYTSNITSGQNTNSITVNWTTVPIGSYQMKVVVGNDCGLDSMTTTINVKQATAVASAAPVCQGGNLQLSASGGVSYSWQGPSSFTSSSANPVIYGATIAANAGMYTVTVTDDKGCTGSSSVMVTINQGPTISISLLADAACNMANGKIRIAASGGTPVYTYLWSNGSVLDSIVAVPAEIYTITVTDMNLCTASSAISVGNIAGPSLTMGSKMNVSCFGGTNGSIDINTSGGTPPISFIWTNGAITEDISGLAAGTYNLCNRCQWL